MARPLREIEAEAIQCEWAREARRRADAFKASGANGTPHEEVMAELQTILRGRHCSGTIKKV